MSPCQKSSLVSIRLQCLLLFMVVEVLNELRILKHGVLVKKTNFNPGIKYRLGVPSNQNP